MAKSMFSVIIPSKVLAVSKLNPPIGGDVEKVTAESFLAHIAC